MKNKRYIWLGIIIAIVIAMIFFLGSNNKVCKSSYVCSNWSICSNNLQSRNCNDINSCLAPFSLNQSCNSTVVNEYCNSVINETNINCVCNSNQIQEGYKDDPNQNFWYYDCV